MFLFVVTADGTFLGDFDEALQMHKQELQLCEALQDPSGKAVANRKVVCINWHNMPSNHFNILCFS